jgi:hypothetical protein
MNLNVTTDGRSHFGNKPYFKLRSKFEGKFAQMLLQKLEGRPFATVRLSVPKQIKDRALYLKGLKLYLKNYDLTKLNDDLSESDYYAIAVVAYYFEDMTPLVNLRDPTRRLSDKYYWVYLAGSPEFFLSTMEIEMFRRRTIGRCDRYSLSKKPVYCNFDSGNKVAFGSRYGDVGSNSNIYLSTKSRLDELDNKDYDEVPNFFIEGRIELSGKLTRSMPYSLERMVASYRDDNLLALLQEIIRLGGTIAGGFVNSLVNPSYIAILLEPPDMDKYDYDDYRDGVRNFKTAEVKDAEGSWNKIIDFDRIIRAFYLQHPEGIEEEEEGARRYFDKISRQQKYQDFDLKKALSANKDVFFTEGNKIYRILYQFSPDVDIFFTGEDYQEKADRVAELLLSKLGPRSIVHHTEFSITFKKLLEDNERLKFQIVKRGYTSVDEVLAGFDLDSSRVALRLLESGKLDAIALDAYINAVECGVNIIVPSRQSETFYQRLMKYKLRGFKPFLPGGIAEESRKFTDYTRKSILTSRLTSDYDRMPWVPLENGLWGPGPVIADYLQPYVDQFNSYPERQRGRRLKSLVLSENYFEEQNLGEVDFAARQNC